MTYKGIVDTSVILRFLTGDLPEKSEKFKALLAEAAAEKSVLLVPLMVTIELAYVLEKIYKLGKFEVRDKIESLLTLAPVQIEAEDVVLEALRLYDEKNLKFGDAMVLARAKVSNIKPLYTFDEKDFKAFPEACIL